jgi:hypothetical protein
MTALIGFNPAETLTSAQQVTSGKGFGLGDRATDHNGNDWIYVQASAAIPQYNVAVVFASATARTFSSANVAGGTGGPMHYGIAASASIAADSYGWVMIKGKAAVKVCASSTGTISGQLYACASANAGLVQTTASGGVKLTTLFAAATATTSTTASTVPVVFGHILTSA